MNVSVFEYATFVKDAKFIAEGKAMLNLVISGLKKEGINAKTFHKIKNLQNLHKKIFEKAHSFDHVILIAPNYELLKISNFLKQNGDNSKFLISRPDALDKTLDKFKLYKELSDKILLPKTIKFSDFENENKTDMHFPIIIKPIYGTGCENILVFKDEKAYDDYKEKQKFNENFIVQEFIDGIHTSVCLFVGREIYPVSLNLQHIKFKLEYNDVLSVNYLGSQVPFFNKFREMVFEYSRIACRQLNLKGYIGMDFVIDNKNEQTYLIEVNPRITTSAIALSRSTNLNIAKLHIACFKDEEILKKELSAVEFSNVVEVLKYKNGVRCRVKDKI